MYHVHHRRYIFNPKDYTEIASNLSSLSEAAQSREVSGDLVIDAKTGRIVTDPSWLFPWEQEDETSYAARAIAWQKRQNEKMG